VAVAAHVSPERLATWVTCALSGGGSAAPGNALRCVEDYVVVRLRHECTPTVASVSSASRSARRNLVNGWMRGVWSRR